MEICSREVRALSNEVKAIEADQQEKFDQVVQQMEVAVTEEALSLKQIEK
ncbi:hypothetical protein F441_15561 [Phytophthora nicotianae CJ01A1]|uniref:Uncharacterized protein n=4 Tax=Phytophthora nicotianae TaxID=4792 RepID=V9DX39_PHYNI|nr:hypothetical protein F443_21626 [Phytophthora nicotianae P1569]ETP08465.1 hypothetical protein F441_15561 [Phytophthora nicotianae CJ01A1]